MAEVLPGAVEKQRSQGRSGTISLRHETLEDEILTERFAQTPQQIVFTRFIQRQHIAAKTLHQAHHHMGLMVGQPGIDRRSASQ